MAKRKMRQELQPGYEGAVLIEAAVRLSQVRSETRSIRCRPGTFEWRYGRKTADSALYHAGVHFADLWERAGIASASSPDLTQSGGGQWKGLPDGRAVALDEVKHASLALGKLSTSRLMAYCAEGRTASELASSYGIPDRDMAAVLNEDLRACAYHFRYL